MKYMVFEIALAHDHYSEEHLQEVIEEMKILGPPVIRAVWQECWDMYVALEGCHRLRAAKALGLIHIIDEIDYDDVCDLDLRDPELGLDFDNDGTVGQFIDEASYRATIIFDNAE
jgi:hypothetical protein